MDSSQVSITRILNWLLIICLCLQVGGNCLSQTKPARIDQLMHTLALRGQFSGSVLVAERGRIIYERGFGKADVKHDIVFTPDTPVYLASLTKQFTAMAVMMLAEKHKLSSDDLLSKYFPEFGISADRHVAARR